MKEYLVFHRDEAEAADDFVIIEAQSADDAIRTFGRTEGLRDSIFREHVYDQSINMSFAASFFYDKSEPLASEENGDFLYPPDEVKQKFVDRVSDFFGNADYARKYLDFFYDYEVETVEELAARHPFPPDMLLAMWYDGYNEGVIALPLDSIPRIAHV